MPLFLFNRDLTPIAAPVNKRRTVMLSMNFAGFDRRPRPIAETNFFMFPTLLCVGNSNGGGLDGFNIDKAWSTRDFGSPALLTEKTFSFIRENTEGGGPPPTQGKIGVELSPPNGFFPINGKKYVIFFNGEKNLLKNEFSEDSIF
uniref:hypothetical protein n=1 Tax=Cephaleuros karstenii TaxID=1985640 RepID=UPI001EE0CE87|nr:hypothetical protein MFR52_pgp082 [Cephaleuros karstenii]UIB39077.1 hypothetical protein [Cephaleuros karstenii]